MVSQRIDEEEAHLKGSGYDLRYREMYDGKLMDCRPFQESLRKLLEERGLDQQRIDDVIDSGYFLRDWIDPFSRRTWTTVSDLMYGNKQLSGSFEIDEFITYINGHNTRIFSPTNCRPSPRNYSGNRSRSVIEASIDYAGKLALSTQRGDPSGRVTHLGRRGTANRS
jgi:hypothetical protein